MEQRGRVCEQCQSLHGLAVVKLTRHMLDIVAMLCSTPTALSFADLSHVLLADLVRHTMHLNMLVTTQPSSASSCM